MDSSILLSTPIRSLYASYHLEGATLVVTADAVVGAIVVGAPVVGSVVAPVFDKGSNQ